MFYVDFFSFHSGGVNNAVYRCQCEEGDAGVFEGDVEYFMLNQNQADRYADWPTRVHLGDSLTMIMTGDLTGVDAPRVQVSDVDSDGVATPQADQADALTHTGTASFDADSYKIADTVTVTITDMDLNTDSELREVYKVHTTDKVEDGDSLSVAAGSSFDHIMDITFDDTQWIDQANNSGSCTTDALDSTGFTLAETEAASGIFVGTFQVPSEYCSSTTASASTTRTDLSLIHI